MNPAARVVIYVVSIVVLAYTAVDAVNCIKAGKMDEASRQLFAGALGGLVAIIATTGKGSPPTAPAGVTPSGTPDDPVSTKEVQP